MSKASVYFTVKSINGKHDVKELKRELDMFHGVISVSVNDNTDYLAVDYDTSGVNEEQLRKKLEKLGYDISDKQLENHLM